MTIELPHILERRQQVEPPLPGGEAEVRGSLIGLALSGGGLRSACFNLGVIQALFRSGLLRHIDYLATVSGGGYIGSFLSSCLLANGVKLRQRDATLGKQLPANEYGQHPRRIGEFLVNGRYLFRPTVMANNYLARLVLWNLILLSGLVCLCATVAFLWRCLDWPIVADVLLVKSHNFVRELTRPFLPAAVLFVLWFGAWLFSAVIRGHRSRARLANALLIAAFASLLIGAAVWLATPNISRVVPGDAAAEAGVETFQLSEPQKWILWTLTGIISAAIVPFLQPQQLLKVLASPKKPYWLLWLINGASLVLLLGVPFLLICLLAKHDLCFWQPITMRPPILHHTDIDPRKWQAFWDQVREESSDHTSAAYLIWTAATTKEDGVNEDEAAKTLLTNPEADCCTTETAKERQRSLVSSGHPLDDDVWQLKQLIVKRLNVRVIGGDQQPKGIDATLMASFPIMYFEKYVDTPKIEKLVDKDANFDLVGILLKKVHPVAPVEPVGKAKSDKPVFRVIQTTRVKTEVLKELAELDVSVLSNTERAELNRHLLEVLYPLDIQHRTLVLRQMVIERDQVLRLLLIVISGICFVLLAFIPLNFTSMHGFYRDRLAQAFIEPTGSDGSRRIPLTDLNTTAKGGPYHLLLAAMNWFPTLPTFWFGPENRPPDGTTGFLFSRRLCGAAGPNGSVYLPTQDYRASLLTLDEVMALSGAAFNPTTVTNPLLFSLMVILNLRLGQWVPSLSYNRRGLGSGWGRIFDLCRGEAHVHQRFLSDGGYHDNLGLWPLLERRCRLIILSDATADPQFTFGELARVIQRARIEAGVSIRACSGSEALPLELIRPHKIPSPPGSKPEEAPLLEKTSRRHYLLFQVVYPDGRKGHLIYLRSSLTGDEPIEVQCHALAHEEFPHEPVGNQLFEQDQVEAYRRLGEHIGEELSRQLTESRSPDSLWHDDFPWPLIEDWCRRERLASTSSTSTPPRTP
jgi:predicted acylesterase/phospholipase RssA